MMHAAIDMTAVERHATACRDAMEGAAPRRTTHCVAKQLPGFPDSRAGIANPHDRRLGAAPESILRRKNIKAFRLHAIYGHAIICTRVNQNLRARHAVCADR
jgi:hypothetical protein